MIPHGEVFNRGNVPNRIGTTFEAVENRGNVPNRIGTPAGRLTAEDEANVKRLANAAERLAHLARLAAAAEPGEVSSIRAEIAAAARVVRAMKPGVLRRMAALRSTS
jgi:hypothetical protein